MPGSLVSTQELGSRLRAARMAKGWSLADLAKAAGLSTSFISIVENGKSDISLGRLARLTDILDVTLLDVTDSEASTISVAPDLGKYMLMRRGDGPWVDGGAGIRMHVLLSSKQRGIERLVITCEPGAYVDTSEFERRRRSETFLLLLKGSLVFGFRDNSELRLRRGDSITFPSHLVISCANDAKSVAEMYAEWPQR